MGIEYTRSWSVNHERVTISVSLAANRIVIADEQTGAIITLPLEALETLTNIVYCLDCVVGELIVPAEDVNG